MQGPGSKRKQAASNQDEILGLLLSLYLLPLQLRTELTEPCMDLGAVLFKSLLYGSFQKRPLTLGGCRNHGPYNPGFPPTLGTSPAPTGTTLPCLRSAPASRPSAAILTAHVTSGWAGPQNARGGKWCLLTPLFCSRGPPRPSQKPRPLSWL